MARNRTYKHRYKYEIEGSTDGVTAGPTATSSNLGSWSSWRDDGSPLPNYRALIRAGKCATTVLNGEIVRVGSEICNVTALREFTLGSVQAPYKVVWPSRFRGTIPGCMTINDPGTPSINVSSVTAKASLKFYRKIKDLQNSFAGMVWAGELRQTLQMLRNPAASLFKSAERDYINALKRRKKMDPRNWARGLSGAYLEWWFGVRPLVQDINDALDTIDFLSQEKVVRRRVSASSFQGTNTVSYHGADADLSYGMAFNIRHTTIETGKVRFTGLYQRDVERHGKSWTIGDRFRQLGFSMSEFVPTVWELLPWSFLVDYFSTVGDVLETSFIAMDDVKWVQKTLRTTKEVHKIGSPNIARMRQLSSTSPKLLSVSIDRPCQTSVNRIKFSRTIESPQPVKLAFEVPSKPLKWLAIGSLLVQANSVHPQRYRYRGSR